MIRIHKHLIYKLTYVIISWIRVLLFTVVSTIIIHVDLQRDISTFTLLFFCFVKLFGHVLSYFSSRVSFSIGGDGL